MRNKIKIRQVRTPRGCARICQCDVLISAVASVSSSVAFIQPSIIADSAHLNTPLLQHHVLVAQFPPKCYLIQSCTQFAHNVKAGKKLWKHHSSHRGRKFNVPH